MTMELTYKQAGDYLIPDLEVDGAEDLEEMPLGKYGMLRETFLEEHHPGTHTSMLLTGRLYPHLREIDRQAQCQRRYEIVRKRRRNFVVFRRGGVTKIRCCRAQKECLRFAASGA